MNKRNVIRDLLVYIFTSARYLLFKGHLNLFLKDLSYFSQWRMYRLSSKGTLDFRVPWLVFSSISFLDTWLKKHMQVFEYGSGGSTLYFAQKTARVISVEHDKEWYGNTKKAINESGLVNINYVLIEPQLLQDTVLRDCVDPTKFVSCFVDYKGYEFSAYANAISSYDDESFELVVVDGRVRHSCIANAMQKIKRNGILLLDNADRTYYLTPFPELNDQQKWKQITCIGHFPFSPASELNTTKLFIKL